MNELDEIQAALTAYVEKRLESGLIRSLLLGQIGVLFEQIADYAGESALAEPVVGRDDLIARVRAAQPPVSKVQTDDLIERIKGAQPPISKEQPDTFSLTGGGESGSLEGR